MEARKTGLVGFLDWFDRSCCSLASDEVGVTFGGIGEVSAVILFLVVTSSSFSDP